MIIVKNDFKTMITTMTHETIEALFADGQNCAYVLGGDDITQKTHWIAEPSIIRKMADFCKSNGELFAAVKMETPK